jgi:hypothetical protein
MLNMTASFGMAKSKIIKLVILILVFSSISFLAACATTGDTKLLDLLTEIAEQEEGQSEEQKIARLEQQDESQLQRNSDDYMRIVGDLRWHELTTHDEWRDRFPRCFKSSSMSHSSGSQEMYTANNGDCASPLLVGGIQLVPTYVRGEPSSGTPSGFMSTYVRFIFQNAGEYRAFKAAISQKYLPSLTMTWGREKQIYCSRYTCWRFEDSELSPPPYAYVGPTPLTISILDDVNIDPSKL